MADNPRFLALVAKVDTDAKQFQKVMIQVGNCTYEEAMAFKSASSVYRALKGEIMRHEPDESGDCLACSCASEHGMFDEIWIAFPCKPFLDMEGEVGK